MASTVTLQNALDLPSPVTLHFEDSNFALDCPYSPTSSLKGVFVHSRPNSMLASEIDLPSEFGQFGMTGNTTVPFIQAPPASNNSSVMPHAMRDRTSRDDCTIRTTASTATTPVRAVRRVEPDFDDEEDVPPIDATSQAPQTRRRTWPSMEGLRSRVSGIFQHKHAALPAVPPPTPESLDVAPAPRAKRAFSFSLRARTSSTSSKIPASHMPVGNIARPRRVRHSRSFSGFTSMAYQVLSPVAEPEELDEVALEAYNSARGIGQFWVYEEDESVAAAILERGVEGW
ncbi:hypothetical protein DFH07DRAFT_783527 [Mycena maculata]|uniref:Uncharacterized protein n=1 Tax=Mycena maculata TaxID=230809 RepID=A0AAD7HMN1_9AGAR|nr:hypothetical protein DFH07DRAFT_783527 [Mycena maculata]